MAAFIKMYQAQLAKRPLATQVTTTATLFGLGDVISQQAIEGKGSKHELGRTGRMALYGGAIFAPMVSQWYKVLERIKLPSTNAQVFARMAADQLLFAPFGTALFFSVQAVLEGSDPKKKLNDGWWTALKTNWYIWPAVQVVNFKFVPLQHRLLVVNGVSLGWNSYLSWMNGQKPESKGVPNVGEQGVVKGEINAGAKKKED